MAVYTLCFLVIFLLPTTGINQLCKQTERLTFSSKEAIPIRVLGLDFDATATTLESKDLLAYIYEANLKYKHGDRATRDAMTKKWQKLFEVENYNRLRNVMVTLRKIDNSNEQVNVASKIILLVKTLVNMDNTVHKFLNSMQVRSDFLTGITVDGIKEVASKMRLSPGLNETLWKFQNNPPNIISAGPSKVFDESVFREYNAPKNLIIHAGGFAFKNGVTTGDIVGQLSALGKEKVMGELIKKHQNTNGYSIYVGNDFLDILAMLKVDIGIAINYTPLFIRFLHALGITTQPVGEWRKTGACSNQEYLIYTAESWYEIDEMMFGDGGVL